MMVKWTNFGLLQANNGKMLVNDCEMLVNGGEMLVINIINKHFSSISLK